MEFLLSLAPKSLSTTEGNFFFLLLTFGRNVSLLFTGVALGVALKVASSGGMFPPKGDICFLGGVEICPIFSLLVSILGAGNGLSLVGESRATEILSSFGADTSSSSVGLGIISSAVGADTRASEPGDVASSNSAGGVVHTGGLGIISSAVGADTRASEPGGVASSNSAGCVVHTGGSGLALLMSELQSLKLRPTN